MRSLGDGRTVGLAGRDGSIDWLPLPDLDYTSLLAAIVDSERGGELLLERELPVIVARRYLPDKNVLKTAAGTIRASSCASSSLVVAAGFVAERHT